MIISTEASAIKNIFNSKLNATSSEQLLAIYHSRPHTFEILIDELAAHMKTNLDKITLNILSQIGLQLQAVHQYYFVTKLHPLVFHSFSIASSDLIDYVKMCYELLLNMGGQTDSVIETNLQSAIFMAVNVKQSKRKIGYLLLSSFMKQIPLNSFKSITKFINEITIAAKSKNNSLRHLFISFLQIYLAYMCEKKQIKFVATIVKGIVQSIGVPQPSSEQSITLYLQVMFSLLKLCEQLLTPQTKQMFTNFVLHLISTNKKPKKALICSILNILPYVYHNTEEICVAIKYLRDIITYKSIQEQISALKCLINIISKTKSLDNYHQQCFRTLFTNTYFANSDTIFALRTSAIKAILEYHDARAIQQFTNKDVLQNFITNAMQKNLNSQCISLVATICKANIFNLGSVTECKILIIVCKILTGTTKRIQIPQQLERYADMIEKSSMRNQKHNEDQLIHSISVLSQFRFSEKYRMIAASLIKDQVLKNYINYPCFTVRIASIKSAFHLNARTFSMTAINQILEIMIQMLAIGLNDQQLQVRKAVFSCIYEYISRHLQTGAIIFGRPPILTQLLQSYQDSQHSISVRSINIICLLAAGSCSSLIIPFIKKTLFVCLNILGKDMAFESTYQTILAMMRHTPTIMNSHADTLLTLLLQKLQKDNRHRFVIYQIIESMLDNLMDCVTLHAKDVCKIVFPAVMDKLNHQVRKSSLRIINRVINQCGFIAEPYYELKNLKKTFIELLKFQRPTQERDLLLKIIGGLGMFDSSLIKPIHTHYSSRQTKIKIDPDRIAQQKQLQSYQNDLVLLQRMPKDPKLFNSGHFKQQAITFEQNSKPSFPPSQTLLQSVLQNIFGILQDSSLSSKHSICFTVLQKIIKGVGTGLQSDLKLLVSHLFYQSNTYYEPSMHCLMLLASLCDFSELASKLLQKAFQTLKNTLFLSYLVPLTQNYTSELRGHLQSIVNRLCKIVQTDNSCIDKCISICQNMVPSIEPYLHQMLPLLLKKCRSKSSEHANDILDLIILCVRSCTSVSQQMLQLVDYLSFLFSGGQTRNQIRNKATNCVITCLIYQPNSFLAYLPTLHKYLIIKPRPLYLKCLELLQIHGDISVSEDLLPAQIEEISWIKGKSNNILENTQIVKLSSIQSITDLINEFNLQAIQIQSDWSQWVSKIAILLLKKSPNIILVFTYEIVDQYPELALQLFNFSFQQFWEVLLQNQRQLLIQSLQNIFTSKKLSLYVCRILLRVVQFMLRKKPSFILDNLQLAYFCKDSSSWAKALYFFEQHFEIQPETVIEGLIKAYIALGINQNVFALIQIAQNMKQKFLPQWHQLLFEYDKAYKAYNQNSAAQLKCLRYLDQQAFVKQILENISDNFKQQCKSLAQNQSSIVNNSLLFQDANFSQIAILAAQCFAQLGKWKQIQILCEKMQQPPRDMLIYTAIAATHNYNYDKAIKLVSKARKVIAQIIIQELSSQNAYVNVCSLQQLVQIQQSIKLKQQEAKLYQQGTIDLVSLITKDQNMEYSETASKNTQLLAYKKKLSFSQQFISLYNAKNSLKSSFGPINDDYKQSKQLSFLCQLWQDRIKSAPSISGLWKRILVTRSLLLTPSDLYQSYRIYCQICLKQLNFKQCHKTLFKLKHDLQSNGANNLVPIFQIIRAKALLKENKLNHNQIVSFVEYILSNSHVQPELAANVIYDFAEYFGSYIHSSHKNPNDYAFQIHLLENANKIFPDQKAFYRLGILNSEIMNLGQISEQIAQKHSILSLRALISGIQFSYQDRKYYLQFYFKLLSLLSSQHASQQLFYYMRQLDANVPIQGWINVVPQIIARLCEDTSTHIFIQFSKNLLTRLGEKFPNSLLYFLSFAIRSQIRSRSQPAEQILTEIKKKHELLVSQIFMICAQLNNAALKIGQFWFDSVQNAWTMYSQNKNIPEAVKILKKMYTQVFERQYTNSQKAFHYQFGNQIKIGWRWLNQYQKSSNLADLSQVFDSSFSIFKKIRESFEYLKKIFLKDVAPKLVTRKKYISVVPGLPNTLKNQPHIISFDNELAVLQSKQRPRKITIYGSDGKNYYFLLKGKQDLRLDQRIMQFLGTINDFLEIERQQLKRDLSIQRYAIVPLSVNTGLIGWVQNCDTLNDLIKQYRQMYKLRLNLEREAFQKMCTEHANLPELHRLQIFKNGLQATQGKDLMRIMWLRSRNSEVWLERRSNYTVSLAVMSIVGYILGLGDRHPSNIMMQKDTGKIVHIDFGDSFQVASLRQKFPEKVPFRLTRMLQKAMGITGIHGLFTKMCERVMHTLRENKDSLVSLLQTFAHDPIISWKIVSDESIGNDTNNIVPKNQKQFLDEKQTKHQADKAINQISSQFDQSKNLKQVPSAILNPVVEVSNLENKQQDNNSVDQRLTSEINTKNINNKLCQDNQVVGRQRIDSTQHFVFTRKLSQIYFKFDDKKKEEHRPIRKTLYKAPKSINIKAQKVLERIKHKLNGTEFQKKGFLTVELQVKILIKQATSQWNLSQSWPGWCPYW